MQIADMDGGYYRIVVEGMLDPQLAGTFRLAAAYEHGNTVLSGSLADRAELDEILNRIIELDLLLLELDPEVDA